MSRITKTYYLDFTGCYRAHVDAELVCAKLDDAGFIPLASPQDADFIIFLGCSFIETAREESIQRILELSNLCNDQSILVAGGCLFRRHQEDLRKYLTEVDFWVNGSNPQDFLETIQTGKELKDPRKYPAISGDRSLIGSPHYAYVKIAEGCQNSCSYCAIPYIRGKYRSRNITDIINEIVNLQSGGVKEIILVAQDSTSYGLDLKGEINLVSLLTRVESVLNEDVKYRLLYLHPQGLHPKLFKFISRSTKILKMLEIPIQHVSDHILKKMNRNYSRIHLENTLAQLNSIVPEVGLRTTLLSGFPGETESDHLELINFIQRYKFQRLGIFSYSQEDCTPARGYIDQIPVKIKKRRWSELDIIAQKIMIEQDKTRIGKKIPAIVDGFYQNHLLARTDWDLPEIDKIVYIQSPLNINIGQWINIKLSKVVNGQIWGVLDQ